MNDLISRKAVLEVLKKYSWCDLTDYLEWGKVERALYKLPVVDAVPVVHAKWIEDGYYGIPCVCSHCGEEAHYTSTLKEEFDYDWDENLISCGYKEIRDHIRSNFCPNCGAKMDAE